MAELRTVPTAPRLMREKIIRTDYDEKDASKQST